MAPSRLLRCGDRHATPAAGVLSQGRDPDLGPWPDTATTGRLTDVEPRTTHDLRQRGSDHLSLPGLRCRAVPDGWVVTERSEGKGAKRP